MGGQKLGDSIRELFRTEIRLPEADALERSNVHSSSTLLLLLSKKRGHLLSERSLDHLSVRFY